MRRLFPVTDKTAAPASDGVPVTETTDREWGLDELAEAYAYPPGPAGPAGPAGPRPWLRANMVATLDGAAQHDGRSQSISGAALGVLVGLDPDAIKEWRVAGHDRSLCRRSAETFKS